MEDEACQMYIYISWNTAMPRAPHPPLTLKGTTALDSLPPCCMFSNLIRLLHTLFLFLTAAAAQSLFNCFLLTKMQVEP